MLFIPVMFCNIANAQVNTSAREVSILTDKFTDNPFRDPDIIYLEADSLINNENDLFTFNLDKKIFMINFISE